MSDEMVFDKSGALDRVDGDKELFFELVEMFFETYDQNIEEMNAAIAAGDGDLLEQNAHCIKSALGNLGAMKAFNLAFQLESAGKSSSLDGCQETLEGLKAAVVQFQTEIKSLE